MLRKSHVNKSSQIKCKAIFLLSSVKNCINQELITRISKCHITYMFLESKSFQYKKRYFVTKKHVSKLRRNLVHVKDECIKMIFHVLHISCYFRNCHKQTLDWIFNENLICNNYSFERLKHVSNSALHALQS